MNGGVESGKLNTFKYIQTMECVGKQFFMGLTVWNILGIEALTFFFWTIFLRMFV